MKDVQKDPKMVPWEPREKWPTVEQVEAWDSIFGRWYVPSIGVYLILWVENRKIGGYTSEGGDVDDARLTSLSKEKILPLRKGHPVSWSEVDRAVAGELKKGE